MQVYLLNPESISSRVIVHPKICKVVTVCLQFRNKTKNKFMIWWKSAMWHCHVQQKSSIELTIKWWRNTDETINIGSTRWCIYLGRLFQQKLSLLWSSDKTYFVQYVRVWNFRNELWYKACTLAGVGGNTISEKRNMYIYNVHIFDFTQHPSTQLICRVYIISFAALRCSLWEKKNKTCYKVFRSYILHILQTFVKANECRITSYIWSDIIPKPWALGILKFISKFGSVLGLPTR
jgi:hypothetical protein